MFQRTSERIHRLQQHRAGPSGSRRVTRNALAGVAARDGEFALEGGATSCSGHFSSADAAADNERCPRHRPAFGGAGSVRVGVVQPLMPNGGGSKDISKSYGLASYNGLRYGDQPQLNRTKP